MEESNKKRISIIGVDRPANINSLLAAARECGMIMQADELETIEIPYEGDVYNFDFSIKDNNQINRIKK